MRLTGQGLDHHRRRPGHRPGDRAQVRQGRRQGRGLRHQPGRRSQETVELDRRRPAARRVGFRVDVTDKDSIATMVEGVMAKWGRIDTLVNNAGIVAGRAVQEDERGPVRPRHRRQPEGRLQLHQGRRRHHARAELGLHPQRVVDRRHLRQLRPDQLRRDQVRRHRHGQDLGARARPQGHPRQRDLPGLHRDADPRDDARQGHQDDGGQGADGPARPARGDRQHLRVARVRRSVLHQRRGDRGLRRRRRI